MALKDKYFTISQAAKEMGVTRQTITRWVKDGNLSTEEIGRETLIKRTELNKYAKFQRNLPFIAWSVNEAKLIVRKKYGYTSEDKLIFNTFNTDKEYGVFMFKVVRKDGTQELVNVKADLETKMDSKIKGPIVALVPIEVWKPAFRESKPKKKRAKKGVE